MLRFADIAGRALATAFMLWLAVGSVVVLWKEAPTVPAWAKVLLGAAIVAFCLPFIWVFVSGGGTWCFRHKCANL